MKVQHVYTSSEILSQIRLGNEEKVLSSLYEDIFPIVKKYVVARGGRKDDAWDVFQESMMILCQKIMTNEFNESASVHGFVVSVAQHKWIDKIRKDRKLIFSDDVPEYSFENENELNKIVDLERSEQISTLFANLGDSCKELMTAIYFQFRSMKEIAIENGYSNDNSVKSQHYKCKQKLLKLINGKEDSLKSLLNE